MTSSKIESPQWKVSTIYSSLCFIHYSTRNDFFTNRSFIQLTYRYIARFGMVDARTIYHNPKVHFQPDFYLHKETPG
jgi:hypothetical protein